MFTRKSIRLQTYQPAIPEGTGGDWRAEAVTLRQQVNALRKEHYEFMRAVVEHFSGLNGKGVLHLDNAYIEATNGIVFPGESTLSHYDEPVNWTPVAVFQTVGDSVWATPTIAVGDATRFGRLVVGSFHYSGDVTHTTASGALRITALPITPSSDADFVWSSLAVYSGITKAGYHQISLNVRPSNTTIDFIASGSGVARSGVVAADVPSGGTVILRGNFAYRV